MAIARPGTCPGPVIRETAPVTRRLRVREIDDGEGRRLVRIVRRGSGSVVTWRRAQMVLLPARGMDVTAISAATCAPATRRRCGSRSSATTSHPTWPTAKTSAPGSGRPTATSNSLTRPRSASWWNRIEAQSPRCGTSRSTAPTTPATLSRPALIRRYIIWRNNHAYDERLCRDRRRKITATT
jgi:hypothetical protein